MRIADLKDRKVAVFVSGGLASWTAVRYLAEKGCRVVALWADVGQFDGKTLSPFFDDLNNAGIELIRRDLKESLGGMALQMVRYQAYYEGGYWNSTGALRAILVKELAPVIVENQCEVFSHGCVGGGNDQRRFQNYGRHYLNGIQEYSPWSDFEFREYFPSRAKMVEYLVRQGIGEETIKDRGSRSTDSCLIGTSYEGEELEALDSSYLKLTPLMGKFPWDANPNPQTVAFQFQNGTIIAINEETLTPADLLHRANECAGQSGICLRSVIENRIRGTKSKGVYESPGMDLLSFAAQHLYSAALGRDELECFTGLSRLIGAKLYQGEYFGNTSQACRLACDTLTDSVNGTVNIQIYRGNLICGGIRGVHETEVNIQERRFERGKQFWTAKS